FQLDALAGKQYGTTFDRLTMPQQATLKAELTETVRKNTYDSRTGVITITPQQAAAIDAVSRHYHGVFGNAPDDMKLPNAYAVATGAIQDPERMRQMVAFFWWTAWSCSTDRPGSTVTYTGNWPHEPLIGNEPTPATVVWSVLSFVFLLAGIGA